MSEAEQFQFVMRVLRAFSTFRGPHGCCEDLWWRTDGTYAPVTFLVSCNDTFDYASADCERLDPDNIAELERAARDAHAADSTYGYIYATTLFCARVRGRRPMPAWFRESVIPPALVGLFDAAGPPRE